jgi:CRP-like cAMP-binding protein
VFKKGDLFVSEGQVCRYVAFNKKGIFREYYYHDGIDRTTDFIFQDFFFSAYTSFINQTPSQVYIEALTDSQTLVMDYKTKQKLFDLVPEWERLARRITEDHYKAKVNRVNILAGLSAKEKYEDLLKNGNKEIIRNIPLQYIASYLGITAETLSRIRKKM